MTKITLVKADDSDTRVIDTSINASTSGSRYGVLNSFVGHFNGQVFLDAVEFVVSVRTADQGFILLGDRLIVVLAGDDVKMVVNVSASGVDGKNLRNDGVAINKLVNLYGAINHE